MTVAAARAAAESARTEPKRPRHKHNLAGWLFVAPVAIGILCFQIGPVMASLGISLTSWSGLRTPEFVGLANYVQMFTNDAVIYDSLRNTAIFTAAVVVLSIALGLVLAVLCNQRIRGIGLFRTLYFSPVVTNIVAICFVWFWLYEPNNGLFNATLSTFGIDGPSWLADARTALLAVIVVAVWQSIGYPMVILLAGLQGIDKSLNEAAMMDGAGPTRRFFAITLPLLTPNIFFLTITQFIASFQVFGIIYVMTSGGPNNATSVFIYEIYQAAFRQGRLGYAAAMGWVLFVIVGVFTAFQWAMEKRWVHYDR